MIPTYFSPLANHLWQSTLSAAVAGLLALVLRKNRAQTRYWLWLAASFKFLIPFSLLVSIGSLFEWQSAPPAALPLQSALGQISQPFALPQMPASAPPASPAVSPTAPALLVAVWFCGCAAVLFVWWRRYRQIRTAVQAASPLPTILIP
ncbi:MAG TPA: hypothetical protein VGQ73_03185, partial [Gemmatimonadales bacterium]|nr:hypothetical protein [Gemmatimonadales bacterium]